MNDPDQDLLQALEYAINQVKLLSQLANADRFHAAAETLPGQRLDEYLAQLRTIDTDTSRMEEMIRNLWQIQSSGGDVH